MKTRLELQEQYGKVLNTQELTSKYEVRSFLAPLVFLTERSTGKRYTAQFQHMPRYYFDFVKQNR